MAVITQNYDIDLKANGAFPVVKCSQFDTGSRTIVFTVYDGWELAKIDGCLARVDGTRSDGVEFSRSCTVSAGSKVSFTITQEMTKHAGKHTAELVIFDASGNPIGTQNFVIDVEAAPMVRDSAASADDRTLYDQYTQSIEDKFNSLSASVTKTADDINALVGASSKPIVVYSGNVEINNGYTNSIAVQVTYDPVTALVHCWINGTFQPKSTTNNPYRLCEIPIEYCPSEDDFAFAPYTYVISQDNIYELVSGDSSPDANKITYSLVQKDDGEESSYLQFAIGAVARVDALYEISLNATWYARGGKYMGVTPIGTGGNTVTVGTTTTGAPGTQASVVNSGTAKDVVLDFAIPRGADGSSADFGGTGDNSILVTRNDAKASGTNGIRIGNSAGATTNDAAGKDSIAIGTGTSAEYTGDIAIGWQSRTGGNEHNYHNLAVGYSASAGITTNDANTIAIGFYAAAGGSYSIAIGNKARTSAFRSVAIGDQSTATEDNTVSLGNQTTKRRIVNVGAPTDDTDAATKAYVDALEAKLTALEARVAALEAK